MEKLIVAGITTVAMTLILCLTYSCADDRRQIVRAIEAGANPISARCSVKGAGYSELLCDDARAVAIGHR